MKHNHTAINTHITPLIQVARRNAYHQAGHAAAIYLGNQQKQLPAVHFQVAIKPQERDGRFSGRMSRISNKYAAKVEGGRLVQSLPLSFEEATRHSSRPELEQYRRAFEADAINLLVAPLVRSQICRLAR